MTLFNMFSNVIHDIQDVRGIHHSPGMCVLVDGPTHIYIEHIYVPMMPTIVMDTIHNVRNLTTHSNRSMIVSMNGSSIDTNDADNGRTLSASFAGMIIWVCVCWGTIRMNGNNVQNRNIIH